MFSFLWKKACKRAAFTGLVVSLLASALFVSCQQPTGPVSPGTADDILGTWESEYGEIYTISDSEFSSGMEWEGVWSGYKGNIVSRRPDNDSGAGYITIKYTENDWNPGAIGNYYVVHYKELTALTMKISGASDSDGKLNQKEAEDSYTVENGCFELYSELSKKGSD
ncbi:MAG: hypothetical protein LBG91_03000 [Treponema sp.]|nr:hypothetical protein [Treponema sp.]